MGRSARIHIPQSLHHVFSKGNGGQEIFGCPRENLLFLGILDDVLRKTGTRLLSYCLMVNHFHLLLETGHISLSRVMQRVETRYAKAFNRHRNRLGHVFQGRFKSKIILDSSYLLNIMRYIPLNPVKSRLVEDPAAWPWSSHAQVIGPIRSSILSLDAFMSKLGRRRKVALERYLDLLSGPVSDFEPVYDEPEEEPSAPKARLNPITLEAIASDLIRATGIDFPRLSGRMRTPEVSAARKMFCHRAASTGFGVCEIAAFLGISPAAAHFHINS